MHLLVRAKTTMMRWGYIDNTHSVNYDCRERLTMAHLLCCRLLDDRCSQKTSSPSHSGQRRVPTGEVAMQCVKDTKYEVHLTYFSVLDATLNLHNQGVVAHVSTSQQGTLSWCRYSEALRMRPFIILFALSITFCRVLQGCMRFELMCGIFKGQCYLLFSSCADALLSVPP